MVMSVLFKMYKNIIKISIKSEKYSISYFGDIVYTVHINEIIVRLKEEMDL